MLKSFDFAFDISVNILDIVFDRKKKRCVTCIDNGSDDKTFVIGKGECRVKIYNKKRESNLDCKELTRIEISGVPTGDMPILFISSFDFNTDMLPDIFLCEYAFCLEDYRDTTTLGLLYAVLHGYDMKLLSRTYANKIKALLKADSQLHFDKYIVQQVLVDTINKYFSYSFKDDRF